MAAGNAEDILDAGFGEHAGDQHAGRQSPRSASARSPWLCSSLGFARELASRRPRTQPRAGPPATRQGDRRPANSPFASLPRCTVKRQRGGVKKLLAMIVHKDDPRSGASALRCLPISAAATLTAATVSRSSVSGIVKNCGVWAASSRRSRLTQLPFLPIDHRTTIAALTPLASAKMPAEEPPPPPAADLGPSDLPAAEPSPAPAAEAAGTGAEHPTTRQDEPAAGMPHRRRRRRRHRPLRAAAAAPAAAGGDSPVAAPAEAAPAGGSPAAETANPGEPVGENSVARGPSAEAAGASESLRPRRRRRRRRAPPRALGSALPPVEGPAGPVAGEEPAEAQDGGEASPATLRLRLPVRPRRRLARPPGLSPGAEGAAAAETHAGEAAPGAPRAVEFPRHRRRRRPPPRPAAAAADGATAAAEAAPIELQPAPRSHGRRYGEEQARETRREAASEPRRRGAAGGPRGPDAEVRGGHARERGPRGRGPGGGRDGQRGRDATPRGGPSKSSTRSNRWSIAVSRMSPTRPRTAAPAGSHWIIVKRTVADQKSGKAMSATYVLQREGAEPNFPISALPAPPPTRPSSTRKS